MSQEKNVVNRGSMKFHFDHDKTDRGEPWSHRRLHALAFCLAFPAGLLVILWACLPVAVAQSLPPIGASPITARFPEITLRERCTAESETTPNLTFMVDEDGHTQTITAQKRFPIRPKTQTAIFIDLFDHKEAVVAPIGDGLEALYKLYVTSTFTITTDTLAVFIPGANQKLETVVDWTGNAGTVVNAVRAITRERAFAALDRTALASLLQETLDQFPPPVADVRQSVVIFSDGTDVLSGAVLDELIHTAQTRHIQLHTFFIPTGYDGVTNLRRLAQATGGGYYRLEDEHSLTAFWEPFVEPYTLCEITYRTHKRQPTELTLWEIMSGTVQFTQTYTMPTIVLTAPVVTIQQPALGATLLVTPTITGQPPSPPVNLAVAWDFGLQSPRIVQRVIYTIKGATTLPPATIKNLRADAQSLIFPIPVAKLEPGAYAVHVQVIDEFGLRGEADAPFALLLAPATPTPTPSPTLTLMPTEVLTVTLTPTATPTLVWYLRDFPYRLLLIATVPLLGALAYGLYNFWQKSRRERGYDGSSSTLTGNKVNAILYRVDSHPDLSLQQVVKLSDKSSEVTRLPDHLYTHPGGHSVTTDTQQVPISAFRAQIVLRDRSYHLILEDDSKPINYKHRNKEKTVDHEVILEDTDILLLGQVQYAFYELKNSSASFPAANNPPPQGQL